MIGLLALFFSVAFGAQAVVERSSRALQYGVAPPPPPPQYGTAPPPPPPPPPQYAPPPTQYAPPPPETAPPPPPPPPYAPTYAPQPPPAQYSPQFDWVCVPGIGVPLSLTSGGDVQCMSQNGRDCLWSDNCAGKLGTQNLQPLVCGSAHQAVWGSTGYDNPIHWCSKAKQYFSPPRADWKCAPGIDVPISLTPNGDVQCMSQNGRDCVWGNCASKLLTQNLQPLVCGAAHQAVWGSTGYDNSNHWCFKGQVYFGGLAGWRCLPGISTPVRYVDGNVQCMAQNGRDCLWSGVCENKLTTPNLNPLTCGSQHQSIYGSTGYTDSNHWCYKARNIFAPPQSGYGNGYY